MAAVSDCLQNSDAHIIEHNSDRAGKIHAEISNGIWQNLRVRFHQAQQLRGAGEEYGAKTGRPRRVGPIDLVATRYGVETQGATNIALTKLDVLSYMEKLPVCAHYELKGQQTDEFPFPVLLQDAKPVVEYLPGWQCDISGARKWEDLPENARRYVEYVEKAIGCHIGFVSVGAERDSLIIR